MAKLVLNQHLCPICGGVLKSIGNNEYKCEYCGKGPYTYEKVEEDFLKSISGAIDQVFYDIKNEQLANLRHRLYELTKIDKYCDSNAIKNVCEDIKKIVPADFFANFYLVANSGIKTSVNEFINQINIEKEYEKLEWVVEFMLRSLQGDNITSMSRLLEKAKLYAEQRNNDSNNWIRLINKFEAEVSRVNNGVYDVGLPRDVFVAYSSKDIDLAYQIVNVLEANDMSCFIAARNLQNGSNATNNYQYNIQKAIDNSTVFLFVSTNNSRSKSCDAYNIEMQYVMNSELLRLGNITHKVYEKLGKESNKKPRIEFVVDKYTGTSIYEDAIKTFFKGYTYCKDLKSLPRMVYTAIQEKETTDWGKTQILAQNQETIKEKSEEKIIIICPDCGAKNSGEAKFCSNCGKNFTVNTVKGDTVVDETLDALEKVDKYVNEDNYEEAAKWAKKAASLGNSTAQLLLGSFYLDGLGVQKDYAEAVHWLQESATKGNARAEKKLGDCYSLGLGVKEDLSVAADWYRKSARQGDDEGQTELGNCYLYGEGIEQNESIAVDWYKKAAQQDNAEAQCYLGNCYYNGSGIAQDYFKAADLFRKSAKQGFGLAWLSLASCYANGEGVALNYEEAKTCLYKAKEIGEEAEDFHLIEEANNNLAKVENLLKNSNTINNKDANLKSNTKKQENTANKTQTIVDSDFEIKDGVLLKYKGRSKQVAIPNTVKVIGYKAFDNCNLTSVVIPNSVTYIEHEAFQFCIELKSISIPASVVELHDNPFSCCFRLNSINVDAGNKSYKSINGNLYTKDGQTLLLYPQGKGGSVFTVPRGVKIISKIAFRSCHHLKTVNIPSSVTNICKGAFFNCDKLQICCEHSRKQAFEEGWNLFNDIGWLFSKKAKVNWGCKIGE